MKNTFINLDLRAKQLAKDYLHTEGELLSTLMEMRQTKAFALLEYSGIFDYCMSELRFSRAQAYYFKTVAEKSEEVPEIRTAILQGQMTLSEARRIVSVVTKENHKEWFEKVKILPQLELERQVTEVNPKAHIKEKIKPIARDLSELRVTLDAEMEEDIRALREILSQKIRKAASLQDVIKWSSKVCREKFDPVRKAERSISLGKRGLAGEQVPEGKTPLAGKLVPEGKQVLAGKPLPDGKQIPVKSGRHKTSASVQHQVQLRDGMQCTFHDRNGRRCPQRRWLHFHHELEVAKGGLNTVENLRLICSSHHRLLHRSNHVGGRSVLLISEADRPK